MFLIKKSAVGIDISDASIELIGIAKRSGVVHIEGKYRTELAAGIVERGVIKQPKALTKHIQAGLKEAGIERIAREHAIVTLPDVDVYTRVFRLTEMSKDTMHDALSLAISKGIPVAYDDLVYAYHVMSSNDATHDVTVIAAEKSFVKMWHDFFTKQLHFSIDGFDTEFLALRRAVVAAPDAVVAVVDFGHRITHIGLVVDQEVIYTRSLMRGYADLHQQCVTEFGIAEEEVATILHESGCALRGKNRRQVVFGYLDDLIAEINDSLQFVAEKGTTVTSAVLSGGMSNMPGLKEYMQEHMDITVDNATIVQAPELDRVFAGCFGAALRGVDSSWQHSDPVISITNHKQGAQWSVNYLKKTFEKQADVQHTSIDPQKTAATSQYKVKSNRKSLSKTHKQLLLLLLIVIIGAAAIVWAFSYQNKQQLMREQQAQEAIDNALNGL